MSQNPCTELNVQQWMGRRLNVAVVVALTSRGDYREFKLCLVIRDTYCVRKQNLWL